jgi:hypothetical protein
LLDVILGELLLPLRDGRAGETSENCADFRELIFDGEAIPSPEGEALPSISDNALFLLYFIQAPDGLPLSFTPRLPPAPP